MNKLNELVLSSTLELRKTRNLVIASMMIAIMCIMNTVSSVYITETIKISFVFIPFAVLCMLLGPAVGGISGMISDILNYIVKPSGTFFPGFTLTAIMTGVIYGTIFYNKKPTLFRCVLAQICISIICDLLLNTFWLTILYGNGFMALLPARIIKELVMFAVKVPTMYLLLNSVYKINKKLI